jgi:host factor-I protein
MAKAHFNIQDQFLNQVRKARIEVEALLMSGGLIRGYVRSFDSFCIILENDDGVVLIYKHGVIRICPSQKGVNVPGLI